MKKNISILFLLVISLLLTSDLEAAGGVRYKRVAAGSTDVEVLPAPSSGRYYIIYMVSATETTGSATAQVKFFDDNDASDATKQFISPVNLTASESTSRNFGAEGPRVTGGVFIDRTGSSEVVITYR